MTLWHSGHVNRWHNNPSHALRNSMDTTWAHSARVAALVYMIVPRLADVNTILAALFHDAAEVVTGDIPGPAKVGDMRGVLEQQEKDYADTHRLPTPATDEHAAAIKMADKLDAYMWARSIDRRIVQSREWRDQLEAAASIAHDLQCVDKFWGIVNATN